MTNIHATTLRDTFPKYGDPSTPNNTRLSAQSRVDMKRRHLSSRPNRCLFSLCGYFFLTTVSLVSTFRNAGSRIFDKQDDGLAIAGKQTVFHENSSIVNLVAVATIRPMNLYRCPLPLHTENAQRPALPCVMFRQQNALIFNPYLICAIREDTVALYEGQAL